MNILFIVPYVPNLIRVRPYNLIRYLSRKGHRVTVMTLWSTESERLDVERLREQCYQVASAPLPKWRSLYNCAAALGTSTPLQAVYCWQPSLADLALEAVENGHNEGSFDVIHIEHLRGAQYGLHLKNLIPYHSSPVPIVWDSVDSISHLFRQSSANSKKRLNRWITRFELGRTEKYESWLLEQFDRILVTSKADQDAFLELRNQAGSTATITVLPNGVDLDYFTPREDEIREPATLVISGKMSYHANISMVMELEQKILPRIWAKQPDVKLWIVGKDPGRDILNLGQHPNITVTGTVEDIRPYLQQATVAVVPLTYGAGIQNKVLEAMACATPVVSSPLAVSALETISGKDYLIGDSPNHFAEQVLRLLDNPELRREIGQNGRFYVEDHHDWSVMATQLERIYQDAIGNANLCTGQKPLENPSSRPIVSKRFL